MAERRRAAALASAQHGPSIYAMRRRPPGWQPLPPATGSGAARDSNDILFAACAQGDAEVVEEVLTEGGGSAIVNATAGRMGMTPLMFAADGGHETVVKMLLDHGASVNVRSDGYGFTALHWCSRNGHLGVAELLVRQPGCDVKVHDETHWTAIDWAQHEGHHDIAELLQRAEGLAMLAARQRLCLAMLSHARLGEACAARCLPSATDGTCDLLVPGGKAGLETVTDHLIALVPNGSSRAALNAVHDRALAAGEVVVFGDDAQGRSICRVLIDWLIILSTYLLTVFLYLTGNLPEGYTFWRTYEVMMRGNPPL